MRSFFGSRPAFLFCMTGTPAALPPEPWCKLVGIEASGGRGPSTVDFQGSWTTEQRKALARAAATARPIGAFSAQALDPAARARGFATAALLADWPAIVGAELAQFTMPDRVVWPRHRDDDGETVRHQGRREEGAVLVLRVDGPRAIEVQHRSRPNPRDGSTVISAIAPWPKCASCRRRWRESPRRPLRPRNRSSPARFPLRLPSRMASLRDALLRLASAPRRGR